MAIVIKRPQAEADLDEIFDYIATDNLERAIAVLLELDEVIKNISANPYMGRQRFELLPNLRSFAHKNYVVFYFPMSNGIDVIRILHGARDIISIFQD
jgi:toxin ParE1/3/4